MVKIRKLKIRSKKLQIYVICNIFEFYIDKKIEFRSNESND